jgi:hypothetical protein
MIEKTCPFMSRPLQNSGYHVGLANILCLRDYCMAWCEFEKPTPSGSTGYCKLLDNLDTCE